MLLKVMANLKRLNIIPLRIDVENKKVYVVTEELSAGVLMFDQITDLALSTC